MINPDGKLYVIFNDTPGPNNINYGVVQKFDPVTNTWTNITPPYDTADGQKAPRGGFAGMSQDLSRPGTIAVSTLDRWYPIDTVYLTHDGGATWIDLAQVSAKAGVNGPPFGNFYHNPSVFAGISPWLTFGAVTPGATAKFGWWMSALLIDPTNPDHLLYGTGATIFATSNLSAADSGAAPSWFVQAAGIEETAVLALISPSQGAHLLSGVGDIGGFKHDDFSASPPAGMYTNPVATTTGILDWSGQKPAFIVRSQSPTTVKTSPCTYGAYSTNGGADWSPFNNCAAGANSGNGGVIAADAAGSMLIWSPATGTTNRPQYSTDLGSTWISTTGLHARVPAVADKVTPATFYAFSTGFYSTTTTGGQTFSQVNTTPLPGATGCNTSICGIPVVNWGRAGDIWLPLGNNGLFHSIDGGVTWNQIRNVSSATSVALGAPAPRSTTPAVFLYGTASPLGLSAIYRSDNNGASWIRINDDMHQYGGPTLIQADPRIYGRVYLGMNGRGIIYGDPALPAVRVHTP